jgi:hypothetical protein
MTPAYLTEREIAAMLNKQQKWLRDNRSRLEGQGFPRVDGLIGLTQLADVKAWLDRRRVVADCAKAHTAPAPRKENHDAL